MTDGIYLLRYPSFESLEEEGRTCLQQDFDVLRYVLSALKFFGPSLQGTRSRGYA